jgi:electron transfer flavoprotein alpha subunit
MAERYLVVADGPRSADLVLGALDPAERDVACVLLGCAAADVEAPLAAARVVVVPGARLDDPLGRIGPPLLELVRDHAVILLDSSQPSRDLAGWLATKAGAQIAWAVARIDGLRVARTVNGGDAHLVQELEPPAILLTKTSTPRGPGSGAAPKIAIATFPEIEPEVRSLGLDDAPQDVHLSGARTTVVVGRGIGGPQHIELFRELAEAVGGALGASRAVVDLGWLPFAHQVGQTGTAVAPELYLGFGISGAVQHVVGMRESRTIVAVNTDPFAPLCEMADIVVEGDAVDVARGLLAELAR